MKFTGSCHCGAIHFEFSGPEITGGLRCNCSICKRKGALMTEFTVAAGELEITIKDDALATYEFGSEVAKQHFCTKCGIYTFHQSRGKPGHYRLNIGCLDNVDPYSLPFKIFDGASI